MIRKSGNRFSEKIMRHQMLERQSIQSETIALQSVARTASPLFAFQIEVMRPQKEAAARRGVV
jgi:hypothetical protein